MPILFTIWQVKSLTIASATTFLFRLRIPIEATFWKQATLSNTHKNIVLHCSNPCFIIVCLDLREGNALVCFATAILFVTLKSGVMIVTNTFHGAMSIPASVGLLLVKQNILQAYAEHTPHHPINTFSPWGMFPCQIL